VPTKETAVVTDEVIVSAQSTSGTVLLVDKYGDEILPPIMYYERAADEATKMNTLKSANTLAKKGVTISPTSPVPKIIEARKKHPQRFTNLRWVLSPTTWLLYKLAYPKGEVWKDICTDWTNGLKFGADPTREKPDWYEPFFQEVGVDLDHFPRLVPCGQELGEAESELAGDLGLRGARLFQGMTEGNSAALGVGCSKEGDFGLSTGDTTVFKYVSNRLKVHQAIYYYKHPFKGYFASAAPVTGGTLKWFTEKVIGITLEKAFTLAEQSPPGSEFSYFPQGDRSPFDDPKVGASFLGIWRDRSTRDLARGRVVRSMVLGLAFLEYYYLNLFERLFERKINEALITGEGTKSGWWNKLRASVYGVRVRVMEERPAIGALLPVVMKLKFFKRLEDAEATLLRSSAIYDPDMELGARYRKLRRTFFEKWRLVREVSKV
jgi:xylulokinase